VDRSLARAALGGTLGDLERETLRWRLSRYPWLWPTADGLLAVVERLVGLTAPPALAPGQTLLLSVDEAQRLGGLWTVQCAPGELPPRAGVPFADPHVWVTATRAVHGALPLLWRTVVASGQPPQASPVGGDPDHRVGVLERDSYGLGLLLGLASHLLGAPLPDDVAVSATVNEDGLLGEVTGLIVKTRQLVEWAPRVRKLLVASGQKAAAEAGLAEARRQAPARRVVLDPTQACSVVECATAEQAVAEVFRDLETKWRDTSPTLRPERIASLVALSLSDRSVTPRWAAVRRAANLALEAWPATSTAEEREHLRLAEAVAARHDGDASLPLELPSEETVAAWPQPQRAERLAHLTQHAADTGRPSPAEALVLAERNLPACEPDAFPAHLQLIGARGRLLATLGRHDDAVTAQRQAALGWLVRPHVTGVSYPLSELYRLAAALERDDLLREVEGLHAKGDRLIPDFARPYLALHRGRALLLLRRDAGLQAIDLLESVVPHPLLGPRAARWLRVAANQGVTNRSPSELDELLTEQEMDARNRAGNAHTAAQRGFQQHRLRWVQNQRALATLDESPADDGAIELLRSQQPELVGALLKHRPHDCAAGEYLRRFFPY
jgi:hypothetical protein